MQSLGYRAIIVLGMHRSGTSALTGVLNLLGIGMGNKLLPKHITNETDFGSIQILLRLILKFDINCIIHSLIPCPYQPNCGLFNH